jgi:hypothetical protein
MNDEDSTFGITDWFSWVFAWARSPARRYRTVTLFKMIGEELDKFHLTPAERENYLHEFIFGPFFDWLDACRNADDRDLIDNSCNSIQFFQESKTVMIKFHPGLWFE